MTRRAVIALLGGLAIAAGAFVVWQRMTLRPENQKPGKFPESIVWARTEDDVVNGGVLFTSGKESAKNTAVIWIHGWGVNFYSPTYVGIGRALAERGYTTVSVNTRMHDIGNVAKYARGKRVRGGGYWGVASEEVLDIAAWVEFVSRLGFRRVVLLGHSAGWSAVRRYQAGTQDERVVGVVLASGAVRAATGPDDAELIARARKLVAEGLGDDLLRLPNRSFPSYVSAATFLDTVDAPAEFRDFFGTRMAAPAVMRVRCPLLAFFGTDEAQVGSEEDLRVLKASVEKLAQRPSRVDTVMIEGADHMYTGQEAQVAQIVAEWADRL